MARPWKEVMQNAENAYRSGKYVYLYGAKDVKLDSEAQIREYFRMEPKYFSRYSEEEKAQIVRNSLGKISADCSGLTGWVCTGDKQYSIGQINDCSKYNTLQAGPTASLLFTTWGGTGKHIGLDTGGGLCMHIGWESTDRAIAEGRAGIIFEPIANRAWEKSGQSRAVDYKGVYSPYEPIMKLWEEIHGAPKPGPDLDAWAGECYGAALINVYAKPRAGALLTSYPNLATGNMFVVVGETGDFFQIQIAERHVGYINKRYCLRKTPERKGTVTINLNLRQNAGPNFKVLRIMPPGTVVDICDTKTGSDGQLWHYVKCAGQYGFAAAKQIK
ncbi:MAG: hypothetical protein IJ820_03095 [Lachnospiraceae bacterium]|nr:hypothetical protein [Lachnospiraceae bacterium]